MVSLVGVGVVASAKEETKQTQTHWSLDTPETESEPGEHSMFTNFMASKDVKGLPGNGVARGRGGLCQGGIKSDSDTPETESELTRRALYTMYYALCGTMRPLQKMMTSRCNWARFDPCPRSR